MSYQVLSLKYRPKNFDELWGQEHVKLTLKNAVEKNRVANAYLFCGPRGVGKTTTARILAKSLNCEKGPTVKPCDRCSSCREIAASRSLDVLEIDGASNRGIDQIRELRENIKYASAHSRYKIYIIDEVHMLTPEAFNALLKTLEEPPAHVKFIFATTAPFKVPPTILSRCQRFDFRKIPTQEIVKRLKWIAKQERIEFEEDALYCIARRAEGSFRDAESMLDQLHSYSPDNITLKAAEELLGILPGEIFSRFVSLLKQKERNGMVSFIDQVLNQGYDLMEFYLGTVKYFRSLLFIKLGVESKVLDLSSSEVERLRKEALGFDRRELLDILKTLYKEESNMKRSLFPRTLWEVISLKLMELVNPKEGREDVVKTLLKDLEEEHPSIAGALISASLKLEGDTLSVYLPPKDAFARGLVKESQEFIEEKLSRILGRPGKISLKEEIPKEGMGFQKILEILGGEEIA